MQNLNENNCKIWPKAVTLLYLIFQLQEVTNSILAELTIDTVSVFSRLDLHCALQSHRVKPMDGMFIHYNHGWYVYTLQSIWFRLISYM